MKTQMDSWRPPHGPSAESVGSASLKAERLDVAGSGRIDAPAEPAPARAEPTVDTTPTPAEIDRLTGLPIPLRFPWLCGGGSALEDAARRHALFEPGPVLGGRVDTSA